MFSALLCYVIKISPEILRLGKRLDSVVRYLVKHMLVEMRIHVESTLLGVQRLLESQNDLVLY
jgi:hypothetical protein